MCRGPVGRHLARYIDVVLDRDGHAEHGQPLPRIQPVLGKASLLACGIGENHAERSQFPVQSGDAIQVQLQQLGCCDGAIGKHPGLRRSTSEHELIGVHAIP